jgi:hypothetical protein
VTIIAVGGLILLVTIVLLIKAYRIKSQQQHGQNAAAEAKKGN